MHLKKNNYPKEDTMKFARFLALDIFDFKLTKLILILSLIASIILMIVKTYDILIVFEGSYFAFYAPQYFILILYIASLFINLIVPSIWRECIKKFNFWNIENANERLLKRLKFETKFIEFFLIISFIIVLIAGYVYVSLTQEGERLYFPYDIFAKVPPNNRKIAICFYQASFVVAAITLPSVFYQTIYTSSHFRHQILLVLSYLKTINTDYNEIDDLEFPYYSNYQDQLKRKLLFIMKKYTEVRSAGMELLDKIRMLIAIYFLSGLAFGISILIYIFSFHGQVYLSIKLLLLSSIINGIGILTAGQQVENLNENIFREFIFLKWYSWNKENKQNYLIFLSCIMKPIRIEFTENYVVNFEMGISLLKGLYSAVSLLQQLD